MEVAGACEMLGLDPRETARLVEQLPRDQGWIAVLPGYTDAQVTTVVRTYLTDGGLTAVNPAIVRNVAVGPATASRVTISYPFNFMVLNPVARLVRPTTSLGGALTMQASALMRNE